ncbi:MAG TPA: twin-arginine translocation pathway signal protein, partial [Pseudonocardiaceae bacterium]
AIDLAHHRLVAALCERWSLAARVLAATAPELDAVRAVTQDVVAQALHAVSAALLTGDPRPLPETAAWAAELLLARGADAGLVQELGELLAAELREYPLARELAGRHWPGGLVAPGGRSR